MTDSAVPDVVVIGAGLAGLVAANRAAEFGLRVAVLEQGTEELYLCNTRITAGVFHVARESLLDPPEQLRRRIEAATCGYSEPSLAGALAEDSARTLEWLKRQGVRFVKAPVSGRMRSMLAPPSVRRPGLNNWKGRAGDVMLRTLATALQEQGGVLLRGARATELLMRDGVCAGVLAVMGGVSRRFECPAVVIADGGFQANSEMVRQHISPAPERVMRRNAGTGSATGQRCAEGRSEAACWIASMAISFYRGAMDDDRFWPYPTLDFLCFGGDCR